MSPKESEKISDMYVTERRKLLGYIRKRVPGGVEAEERPLSLEEILPAIGSTPGDEELKELIWEKINETLKELPEEQSEVFIANEFEDMSFKDISAKTGVGVNTLISRKRYAVLALRKELDELYKLFKNK